MVKLILNNCRILSISILLSCALTSSVFVQAPQTTNPKPPTHADILRGEYGRYRANNDLLWYDLDIRVDPAREFVSDFAKDRWTLIQPTTEWKSLKSPLKKDGFEVATELYYVDVKKS